LSADHRPRRNFSPKIAASGVFAERLGNERVTARRARVARRQILAAAGLGQPVADQRDTQRQEPGYLGFRHQELTPLRTGATAPANESPHSSCRRSMSLAWRHDEQAAAAHQYPE
jgi:hypothetical protein